jgi:hypothetical protein
MPRGLKFTSERYDHPGPDFKVEPGRIDFGTSLCKPSDQWYLNGPWYERDGSAVGLEGVVRPK